MTKLQNVVLLAGENIPDALVGDLVERHEFMRWIFEAYGVDCSTMGGLAVAQACAELGLAPAELCRALESSLTLREGKSSCLGELTVPERIDHIIRKHHGYIRRETPRLMALSRYVVRLHGGHDPRVVEVCYVLGEVTAKIIEHLRREEIVLFPAIASLGTHYAETAPLDEPVARMLEEHSWGMRKFARLRQLTNDYRPSPAASEEYRALCRGLEALEHDLRIHAHAEETFVFPGGVCRSRSVGLVGRIGPIGPISCMSPTPPLTCVNKDSAVKR